VQNIEKYRIEIPENFLTSIQFNNLSQKNAVYYGIVKVARLCIEKRKKIKTRNNVTKEKLHLSEVV